MLPYAANIDAAAADAIAFAAMPDAARYFAPIA